jgi:hypothetical protein
MNPTANTQDTGHSSAISRALRSFQELLDAPQEVNWEFFAAEDGSRFRITVAADRATRVRAYRLAYQVYAAKGYAAENEAEMIVCPYDERPDTFTLLMEDDVGNAIATATLVKDDDGLPCDEIFGLELDVMRMQDRRLVEVTRLCIADEYRHCRDVLVRLLNFLFIHGVRNQGYTDCVIEVNPRHAHYYQRLLGFEPVSRERPCPRVKGAPAVLLHLDLALYDREVKRLGGTRNPNSRSLYAYFQPYADEADIAAFLANRHKPMSKLEARYFHLAQHNRN